MWGLNVLVVAFVISATSIEARFLESLEKFLENQAKLEVNAHQEKYVSTGDGIQRALRTECTGNICRNWFQQCKKPITCAEEWCEYDKTVHPGGCEILPGTLTDSEWNALREAQIANTIPVINDCSSCGDSVCECTYGIIKITETGKCHRIDNMLGSGGLGSGCYFHKVKPAGGYAITDDAAYESFTDLIGKRNDERIISTRDGNWEWIGNWDNVGDDCIGNICRHWYQQCNPITCSSEWCEFDKSIHSGCGIVGWPGTMSEELWEELMEEQKTTLPDIFECACGSPYCECNYGVIKITESVQHGGKCHILDNKSSGCWFQFLNKILDGDKEVKMDERNDERIISTKEGNFEWTDCTGNICKTWYQQCNLITCAEEWCQYDKTRWPGGCEIYGYPGTLTEEEWNALKDAQATNTIPAINDCSSCGSKSCTCTYGVIKITESIYANGEKCHRIDNMLKKPGERSGCFLHEKKSDGKMLNYNEDKEIRMHERNDERIISTREGNWEWTDDCIGNMCRQNYQQCNLITCSNEWCEFDKSIHSGCGIVDWPGTMTDAEWNDLKNAQRNNLPDITECACGSAYCECNYVGIKITESIQHGGKCHLVENKSSGCWFQSLNKMLEGDKEIKMYEGRDANIATREGDYQWTDECTGNMCRTHYQQCNLITCADEWCEFDKSIHSGCEIQGWPGTMTRAEWNALKNAQTNNLPSINECSSCGSTSCECTYGVIKITESIRGDGGKCHLIENKSSGCWFYTLKPSGKMLNW